jgi:hypothetical protein
MLIVATFRLPERTKHRNAEMVTITSIKEEEINERFLTVTEEIAFLYKEYAKCTIEVVLSILWCF